MIYLEENEAIFLLFPPAFVNILKKEFFTL